ncbi:MAG: alkaline phosphatase [Desulfovibrio sp.]
MRNRASLVVRALVLGLLALLALTACKQEESASAGPVAKPEASLAPAPEAASPARARYVFFFIGDGMGLPQRAATAEYLNRRLVMDGFPAQGITTTMAADRFITGSAASATALCTGVKTNIGYIGMDPQLRPMKTIAEMARDQGMKVGIVSSVSIDHATPAAFYAHVKSRSMYHEIDHALVESGFDFFGGGGLKDPRGERQRQKNPDAPVLGDALAKARDNGYRYVNDKAAFQALTPEDGKVIAVNEWLQDGGALPYVLDMTENDITLPEFTSKAVEMLDNEQGFFLMVEGGKIDWACHANDATSAVTNNASFDEAVQVAVDFAQAHPDETLIVVTGDHECGGLTLGFAGTKYESYFDVLGAQTISFQKFTDEILPAFVERSAPFAELRPVITEYFGLSFSGDPATDRMVLAPHEAGMLEAAYARSLAGEVEGGGAEEYLLYGEYDPLAVSLTHVLNRKAGLAWTSYKHTGVPVSTSAMGVGHELFNGAYDNTDVALKIMQAMGLEPQARLLTATR